MEDEKEDGDLHKMMSSFQKTIFRDLELDDFADMYAQTITYGLLQEHIPKESDEEKKIDVAIQDANLTNPFSKKTF